MRTIEQNMRRAISSGKKHWQSGNTRVENSGDEVRVYLHGNLIAVCKLGKGWSYSLAGWNTVTTRSRLNALGCGVSCKNFTPYRNGKEWWGDF